MLKPNFQEQLLRDLDNVFFNKSMMEFVTPHMVGGIRGKPAIECDIVADHELYQERKAKDGIENISLDGIVVFFKEADWREKFGSVPKVGTALELDNKRYSVEAVNADMNVLEITLTGARG